MWESSIKRELRYPLLIALFLFISALGSCTKKVTPGIPSQPVHIGEVIVEDIPHYIKGVGVLGASLAVDIKAQVSGILTNVLFKDGQLVEEGELLMTIDQRIYEAQVHEAIAQLNEDQARLRYAMDFAETYGTLVGKEYVSRLNYEEAIQNADVTKAAVEFDMAAVKKAQVDLDYTQIRAPFKGYIGLRKYDPGNYVLTTLNEKLATIRKVTPLAVKFYLPAEYVPQIREKQKESPLYLEASLSNDPGHPLEGSLWFIDNTVDPQTGMILLEGTIPNLEERGWPGEFVRVNLRVNTLVDAVLVPRSAVVLSETGYLVYVLNEENMTVSMRMIGKGFVYKDFIVALWGLKGRERVVVDGQLNLHEGALVRIVKS